MHKANRRVLSPPVFKTITVPADAALSRLLRSCRTGNPERDRRLGGLLGGMAVAADPRHPLRAVEIPVSLVPVVAGLLAGLLTRARAAGDPAADALAKVAAQLGVTEPAPGQAPVG